MSAEENEDGGGNIPDVGAMAAGAMGAVGNMMGMGDPETASNQEVSHESGASRLMNKTWLMCASPFFILFCLILLGWNEKRAVCDAKAIVAGKEKVKELGCDEATKETSELIMFSCDLNKEGLTAKSVGSGAFSSTMYTGVCLASDSDMYQCVQKSSSKTTKDKVGGGKTTVTTYTYSKEWKSTRVSSENFNSKGRSSSAFASCSSSSSFQNPAWPSDVPMSASTSYVKQAKIGSFTIPQDFVKKIDCKTPVTVSSVPPNWVAKGSRYQRGADGTIGSVMLGYKTNSWAAADTMHTVLGKNKDGAVELWTAPDSWLCSGTKLSDLRKGKHTKDELFKALEAENTAVTWFLRFLGFVLMWWSCSCLLGPLEVLADCIPCIGPYLGDMVDAVICIASCPPSFCCCLAIVAIVWVVMRPVVGGCLMAVFLLGMCCFSVFGLRSRNNAAERRRLEREGLKGNQVGKPSDTE